MGRANHHRKPNFGDDRSAVMRHMREATSSPEEGRPGGPAKIEGIVTPVQPQTKAAQKQLMDQRMMQGVSLNISVSLKK